jgi:hypothetical protein
MYPPPNRASRKRLRSAWLAFRMSEAEVTQSLSLYDNEAILWCQVPEHTTPFRCVTPSAEIPQHAGSFPGQISSNHGVLGTPKRSGVRARLQCPPFSKDIEGHWQVLGGHALLFLPPLVALLLGEDLEQCLYPIGCQEIRQPPQFLGLSDHHQDSAVVGQNLSVVDNPLGAQELG